MLFNSIEFLLFFLPITTVIYFLISSIDKNNNFLPPNASKIWLALASIFFYCYWDWQYFFLIMASILINFTGGTLIIKRPTIKKQILVTALIINLALLAFFKYTDFLLININAALETNFELLNIVLPLGISFFTFTQIAFLVDAYKGRAKEYDFSNYVLFVTFFPHLLAGPIIHHKEMMPQFGDDTNRFFNYRNFAIGLFLLSIGLFKKIVIADNFIPLVNAGFLNSANLSILEAWAASLSYTFQIYFDFSGYTDIALGTSLMFNIRLPINFSSPYKSLNIQDFWRRWHMTLSRFLRDYIYIPLGGNRVKEVSIIFNLMTTFILGGIWHGAGWTFIIWGTLHGLAITCHRMWGKLGIIIPKALSWFITFNFINITWVFFRAETVNDALNMIGAMFGSNGLVLSEKLSTKLGFLTETGVVFDDFLLNNAHVKNGIFASIILIIICLYTKNSNELADNFKPNLKTLILTLLLLFVSITCMSEVTEFLYFNF